MMPRRAAIGTYAVVLVAIIAVAAISIMFVASQSGSTSTTMQPSSSSSQSTTTGAAPTTTTASTSSSTSNTTSTICIVAVEGVGTYLHIVSDSTQQPLAGITVNVLPTANSCLGASIPGPATYTTNATGWVSMGGLQANYYFETSLTYTGRNYSFILPQGPLDSTNATLSLPSGNLSISLCYALATANPCKPYTESTTTNTSTQTGGYGGSEVSGPLRTSIASSIWNFTVSINTNSPAQGQTVQLVAELTNIGSTNETVTNFVEPYINPEVYVANAANSTAVWAWNPPEVTSPTFTIASGQTLTQTVNIPTSQLSAGQTYSIMLVPLTIPSTPPHIILTITMQFSVG